MPDIMDIKISTHQLKIRDGIGSIPDAIKVIEQETKNRLKQRLGEGGLEALPFVNKDIPRDLQVVVNEKIGHIQSLMAMSQKALALSGAFGQAGIPYEVFDINGEQIFDFGKSSNMGLYGSFVESKLIFGGLTKKQKGEISSGTTSPKPDLITIQTELKTYSHLDISSGAITAEIVGTSEEEEAAYELLVSNVAKAEMAVWELANKMRNLLLIKIGFLTLEKTSKYAKRLHIQAIIFFVEIIVRRIYEWINASLGTNLGGAVRSTAKAEEMKGSGIMIVLEGEAENERKARKFGSFQKTPPGGKTLTYKPEGKIIEESGGEIRFKQTYRIKLSPLSEEELRALKGGVGDIKKIWEKGIKRLTDLYAARFDLLDTISGTGHYAEAALFFHKIKTFPTGFVKFSSSAEAGSNALAKP